MISGKIQSDNIKYDISSIGHWKWMKKMSWFLFWLSRSEIEYHNDDMRYWNVPLLIYMEHKPFYDSFRNTNNTILLICFSEFTRTDSSFLNKLPNKRRFISFFKGIVNNILASYNHGIFVIFKYLTPRNRRTSSSPFSNIRPIRRETNIFEDFSHWEAWNKNRPQSPLPYYLPWTPEFFNFLTGSLLCTRCSGTL